MINNDTKTPKLWNKNFNILVVGSFISMMGYICASFAMGLLVFDQTNSILSFALSQIAAMLPRIITPTIAGTFFDRHSRRKAIFFLDYCYTAIFLFVGLLLKFSTFSFGIFIVIQMLLGSIDGVYMVAFDSLFPLMTTTKTSTKAFSVNSLLNPIALVLTTPLTLFGYEQLGAVPIFLGASVLFFVTATIETQIIVREPHLMPYQREKQLLLPPSPKEIELAQNGIDITTQIEKTESNFFADFKEGLKYIGKEKGLLAITLYFFAISLCGSIQSTLAMPYFRTSQGIFPIDGTLAYIIVFGASTVGRLIGGVIQYKVKMRADKKYTIAYVVYIVTNIITMLLFHLPMWLMIVFMLIEGTMSVTSYNIRISATQNYVPDNKRGRFNGTFLFFNMLGSVLGQLIAGLIGDSGLSVPWIITVAFAFNLLCVFIFIIPNKKYIAPIYNVTLS